MDNTTIKIARYRNTPYKVNFKLNGAGVRTFLWEGSKPNFQHVIDVPTEVIQWLAHRSRAFAEGELVVLEREMADQAVGFIDKNEDNSHTRDEIVKFLSGNNNTLKSKLNKITDAGEMKFVLAIAEELKIDSVSKQKIIAEWANLPVEVLFASETE